MQEQELPLLATTSGAWCAWPDVPQLSSRTTRGAMILLCLLVVHLNGLQAGQSEYRDRKMLLALASSFWLWSSWGQKRKSAIQGSLH